MLQQAQGSAHSIRIGNRETQELGIDLPPQVERPAVRVVDFLKSREGLQTIVKPAAKIGGIFLSPGIYAYTFGIIVPGGGWVNHLRAITTYSTQFWLGFSIPEKSFLGFTFWSARMAWSVVLFNKLCINEPAQTYAAWKLARIQIFYDNLMIPERFHEDPFLQRHVCPITSFPIRFPTKDIYGHYWEDAAIRAWLQNKNTSPLTRQPLTLEDLTFDEELYRQIGDRISELKNGNNQV